MTVDVPNKEAIEFPLGRVVSGVYILTASDGKNQAGMMASWVAQAGFEPPAVSVAVHPDREVFKIIEKTKKFTLNSITKDNFDIMKAFGKYSPDQFDSVNHDKTQYGAVLKDGISAIHCELKNTADAFDHKVLIAEVVNGVTLNQDLEPFVHIRKSGFSY